MNLGNVARVVTVAAACLAAVGSASSNKNTTQTQPDTAKMNPPPPQEMDPSRVLGLWRSTFGAVKIEPDPSKGGLQSGAVQGVWVYQRQGQEVVGYFSGSLRGNVLEFRWQEPNNPPLTGAGYIVFEQTGRQYSGRWWSDKRDRVGDWNGWRQTGPQQQQPGQYGGQPYGAQQSQQPGYAPQQPQQGYPPPAQQPQQGYPPPAQQQPYQPPAQQPYPPAQQQPPQQQQPYQPTQPQPYYPPPRAST